MSGGDDRTFGIARVIDGAVLGAVRKVLLAAGIEIRTSLSREAGIDRAEWALRHAMLERGRFSFVRHEYLRGIYECESPHIVIEKAAQMGGSVFGILDMLWALDTGRIRTGIYFFPTARDMEDFVHDRVRPVIEGSEHLSGRTRGVGNVHYLQFKGVGTGASGSLYFRGMKSKVSTSSVPADQIMVDERDKVSTADYELALKRLSHSEKAIVREACTPTVAGYGIDALFERSDMRFWTMKCASCGTENRPERTFREDGDPGRVIYEFREETYLGCAKCAGRLDPSQGFWVAEHPGREIAGFHLSQLYSQVVQRGRPVQHAILDDFRNAKYVADFWNSRIGFPYEDAATALGADVLDACDGGYPAAAKGECCTMGVDQGNELHFVISSRASGMRKIVRVGVLDSFEALDVLMSAYDVRLCVMDALPNTHSAKAFAARFPGRVFLCFYSSTRKAEATWNAESATVVVDRTYALDAAAAEYFGMRVRLPRCPEMEEKFKPQMRNLARKPERDAAGDIVGYEWVRRGPDHFRHADCYDYLAGERRPRGLDEMLSGVAAAGRRNFLKDDERSGTLFEERPAKRREGSDRRDMNDW